MKFYAIFMFYICIHYKICIIFNLNINLTNWFVTICACLVLFHNLAGFMYTDRNKGMIRILIQCLMFYVIYVLHSIRFDLWFQHFMVICWKKVIINLSYSVKTNFWLWNLCKSMCFKMIKKHVIVWKCIKNVCPETSLIGPPEDKSLKIDIVSQNRLKKRH